MQIGCFASLNTCHSCPHRPAAPVPPALRASLVVPPPGRVPPPHSCVSSCTCRSAAFTSWLMDSVDRKGCMDGRRECGRQ